MESFRYHCRFWCILKGVFILIAIFSIVGYAWYADLLPFELDSSMAGFTPSVENIQQISNVVTSKDHQIIYYSFEDVPNIPNEQIPVDALKKAIETWEQSNPNLEFIQSENSNIEIKWQKYSSTTHTGLATCNSVLFGILSHCVLDISVGAKDCNSCFSDNSSVCPTNNSSNLSGITYPFVSNEISGDSVEYIRWFFSLEWPNPNAWPISCIKIFVTMFSSF